MQILQNGKNIKIRLVLRVQNFARKTRKYPQTFTSIANSRFWFENGNDEASRFRLAQLDSLRDTSMARVICDNTDIEEVQPLAFRVEDNRLLISRIFCFSSFCISDTFIKLRILFLGSIQESAAMTSTCLALTSVCGKNERILFSLTE